MYEEGDSTFYYDYRGERINFPFRECFDKRLK